LSIYTVEPAPMATAGPQMGQFIIGELQKRDIAFYNQKRCKNVDSANRVINFEDGSTAHFDLLIAIPFMKHLYRFAKLSHRRQWLDSG
jgi:NADPH-dependent 2,4-dienoyl-CoA reductase/sulfur reductase-like enzyme